MGQLPDRDGRGGGAGARLQDAPAAGVQDRHEAGGRGPTGESMCAAFTLLLCYLALLHIPKHHTTSRRENGWKGVSDTTSYRFYVW